MNLPHTNPVILFEVYDKRVLHQHPDTLVLLDRDTAYRKAEPSARKWGGCVVKVTANLLERYPLKRQVLSYQVVYTHVPQRKPLRARDRITFKQLKGKLRSHDKSLHQGRRGRL